MVGETAKHGAPSTEYISFISPPTPPPSYLSVCVFSDKNTKLDPSPLNAEIWASLNLDIHTASKITVARMNILFQ